MDPRSRSPKAVSNDIPASPAELTPSRAKPLPRRLPLSGAPPELVPARMINETLYCERLLYLEWAQGEFADNVFTVEGRAVHRRTDESRGDLPPTPPEPREPPEQQPAGDETGSVSSGEPAASSDASVGELVAERPYEARSIWLSSDRLGITAKIDVVEGTETGTVTPIEYKRGKVPDVPGNAYLPERAQICAQVLLLREHGYRCTEGAIYFAGSRRRVPIEIDDWLVQKTLAAAARARELTANPEPPPPLEDSPKCWGCSLTGICLPDETNLLRRLEGLKGEPDLDLDLEPSPEDASVEPDARSHANIADASSAELHGPLEADPWDLAGPQPDPPRILRRLHPARDDKVPLYVQENGARIGLKGDRLLIQPRHGDAVEARLSNTSQVVIYGNAQLSTPAMRALLERGVPVSFFSYGGWYYGRATGFDTKNVELRVAQHRAAQDAELCLSIARGMIASKIRNCRTLLRRNHHTPDPVVLGELEQLAKKAEQAPALESLLGLEGTAARYYFGGFTGMLKGEAAAGNFDLDGRNRRPPRDPINALLSFCYAHLTKEFALTVAAVGLDPLLGFYHQPRFGRPALALDLMEEYRPLIADSVVIGALNNGVITADDFVVRASAVALKPGARKKLILAYERRMDQLVTHPVFGYRISYRRVLEVQARLLGRLLLGELDHYPAFRTR
jgi:CRISP-associated protein Cas1